MDSTNSSDPYCKIDLGKESKRSKVKTRTLNPQWREGFDLFWEDETDGELQITIWDQDVGITAKDDFMGR